MAQERARTEWDQRVARAAVERSRALATQLPQPAPSEGAPVARLVIDRIGLDDIVLEGVTAAALNGGPGHLPGSSLPGTEGNAVISAHRDRHFRRLGELTIGDTIRTQTISNSATCWPIGYLGGAPERLILRAVPVATRVGSAADPASVDVMAPARIATNANATQR